MRFQYTVIFRANTPGIDLLEVTLSFLKQKACRGLCKQLQFSSLPHEPESIHVHFAALDETDIRDKLDTLIQKFTERYQDTLEIRRIAYAPVSSQTG